MKRYLLIALLGLFVASPVWGQVDWTAAFEATPADDTLVSLGDDRIRELKSTVREQLTTEHDTSNIGVLTDTARHHEGAARAFVQAAEPATLVHADADASNALDDGRIYIDEDDSQPFFRDESAATQISAIYGAAAADWISLWPRSFTLQYPSTVSDEIPGGGDDTRDTITGISGVSVDIPDDGRAYELMVRAVVKYHLDTAGNAAIWLEETAPAAADRDMAFITAVGSQEDTGTIVLEYLYTAPVNGTTYTFDVDMAASTAASFFANPTSAVINGGVAGVYAVTDTISRLDLIVRPRYLTATY